MKELEIAEVTKNIINEYLAFSGKENSVVTLTEYMLVRKQAVSELTDGIHEKNEISKPGFIEEKPFESPSTASNKQVDVKPKEPEISNMSLADTIDDGFPKESEKSRYEILRGIKDQWN